MERYAFLHLGWCFAIINPLENDSIPERKRNGVVFFCKDVKLGGLQAAIFPVLQNWPGDWPVVLVVGTEKTEKYGNHQCDGKSWGGEK